MAHPSPRDEEFTGFLATGAAPLARTAWELTGDREAASALVHDALVRTYLAWPRVGREGAAVFAASIMTGRAGPPTTTADAPTIVVDRQRVLEDAREALRGRRLGWTVALLTVGTVLVAFGVPPLIAALIP